MSVRTRLGRLEAAMPAEPEPEGEVIRVCDVHRDGECREDEHPLGGITIRIVDRSVLKPLYNVTPERIAELRAEALAVKGVASKLVH